MLMVSFVLSKEQNEDFGLDWNVSLIINSETCSVLLKVACAWMRNRNGRVVIGGGGCICIEVPKTQLDSTDSLLVDNIRHKRLFYNYYSNEVTYRPILKLGSQNPGYFRISNLKECTGSQLSLWS
jgi:hypothetical protein